MTLSDRIEQLLGPDREVDAEIHELLFSPKPPEGDEDSPPAGFGAGSLYGPSYWGFSYTASIDSAMTLADGEMDPLDILEEALAAAREAQDGVFYLPLHICAAALRAKGL